MASLEIHEESLLSIINASPVGMLLVDKNSVTVFYNKSAQDIFGLTDEDFHQLDINHLIPVALREKHRQLQDDYRANPKPIQMGKERQVIALRKNGDEITVEVGLSPFVIKEEHYILVSIIDVSAHARVKELELINRGLEIAAMRDMLTGLPNRRLIYALIDNQKNLAIRSNSKITVMFVDLDGFKEINDQHGHYVGDRLLCEIARRLKSQIRKSDIVGRLGGDEFLLSFTDLGDKSDMQRMADNVLKCICDVKDIEGYPIRIGASIGVCYASVTIDSQAENIIKIADELMYEAKKRGKGQAVIEEYGMGPE